MISLTRSDYQMPQFSLKMSRASHMLTWFKFFLCLLLMTLAVGLTTQNYDPSAYANSLENSINRFSYDISTIKGQFSAINLQLANTNVSDSAKVIFLQQTLAEQRNSLFNIETYLSIPYALRSCQCLNLTDSQRKLIAKQVEQASQSITQLQDKISKQSNGQSYENPLCPNQACPEVMQLNMQIKRMQNYVRIMKDTISSRCCQIVKYVYYDNLLATDNWEYGSITEEQYRQANSKKALKEELTRCPKETPFANENNNTCFNCPATLPLFNLGTRKCIAECEHPGFVLNVTQHRCDYNRSCPPGQVFSNNSLTCEIDMGNITKSSCALSTPVWNKIKLRCEECPETSPFYDKHVKSCRKCTENEVFDSETKTCLNSALAKCPEGTFFNVYKNQCQSKKQTDNGTESICPPKTPYWSPIDYACTTCPTATPVYNKALSKCESCFQGSSWSSESQSCIKHQPCPTGQTFNTATSKCQSQSCPQNQSQDSTTSTCKINPSKQFGLCSPETPVWNVNKMICEECPKTTPSWNSDLKSCEVCKAGTTWNKQQNACSNNNNAPAVGTNTSLCPTSQPSWNTERLRCQACPTGTSWNTSSKACTALSSHHAKATQKRSHSHRVSQSRVKELHKKYSGIQINQRSRHRLTTTFPG